MNAFPQAIHLFLLLPVGVVVLYEALADKYASATGKLVALAGAVFVLAGLDGVLNHFVAVFDMSNAQAAPPASTLEQLRAWLHLSMTQSLLAIT